VKRKSVYKKILENFKVRVNYGKERKKDREKIVVRAKRCRVTTWL
jgi:hypothetical protein